MKFASYTSNGKKAYVFTLSLGEWSTLTGNDPSKRVALFLDPKGRMAILPRASSCTLSAVAVSRRQLRDEVEYFFSYSGSRWDAEKFPTLPDIAQHFMPVNASPGQIEFTFENLSKDARKPLTREYKGRASATIPAKQPPARTAAPPQPTPTVDDLKCALSLLNTAIGAVPGAKAFVQDNGLVRVELVQVL